MTLGSLSGRWVLQSSGSRFTYGSSSAAARSDLLGPFVVRLAPLVWVCIKQWLALAPCVFSKAGSLPLPGSASAMARAHFMVQQKHWLASTFWVRFSSGSLSHHASSLTLARSLIVGPLLQWLAPAVWVRLIWVARASSLDLPVMWLALTVDGSARNRARSTIMGPPTLWLAL